MISEEKAISLIIKHMNSQFPRNCKKCGKVYNTYKEFLLNTTRVGNPVPHDDDEKLPKKPIGTYTYYNCDCGTTMLLGSRGMSLATIFNLMLWGRKERKKRGLSLEEFLLYVRETVDKKVMDGNE